MEARSRRLPTQAGARIERGPHGCIRFGPRRIYRPPERPDGSLDRPPDSSAPPLPGRPGQRARYRGEPVGGSHQLTDERCSRESCGVLAPPSRLLPSSLHLVRPAGFHRRGTPAPRALAWRRATRLLACIERARRDRGRRRPCCPRARRGRIARGHRGLRRVAAPLRGARAASRSTAPATIAWRRWRTSTAPCTSPAARRRRRRSRMLRRPAALDALRVSIGDAGLPRPRARHRSRRSASATKLE
jgi:hypothetical protein